MRKNSLNGIIQLTRKSNLKATLGAYCSYNKGHMAKTFTYLKNLDKILPISKLKIGFFMNKIVLKHPKNEHFRQKMQF